jgi:hypothetical protein
LASLPALRVALEAADVSWSMAELVSRHATPETDHELTAEAKRHTVRQMRERLGGRKQDGPHPLDGGRGPEGVQHPDSGTVQRQSSDDQFGELVASCPVEGGPWVLQLEGSVDPDDLDEHDPICTLSITVDREVGWMLEGTRTIIELLNGNRSTDEFVHCALAEALTSLPDSKPTGLGLATENQDEEAARQRAWLEQCATWRMEAERLCEQEWAAWVRAGQRRADAGVLRNPAIDRERAGVDRGGAGTAVGTAGRGRDGRAPPNVRGPGCERSPTGQRIPVGGGCIR